MRGRVRRVVSVVAVAALAAATAGCVSVGQRPRILSWPAFERLVRERGLDPAGVVYPFATTPEMEAFARRVTAGLTAPLPRLYRLQEALFDRAAFPFAYDARTTVPAPEAFRTRRGNCLSFTVLFVALSRSLGYPTRIYSVRRVLDVDRAENLVVVNRHVVAGYRLAGKLYVFDFSELEETFAGRHRPLDDLTVAGMFHVNRGALLLERGDLAGARRELRIAIRLAPAFAGAWIDLGVVERRMGRLDEALAAYRRALELEPGSSSALTNIAYLHELQGRHEEARAALAAAARGASSPYALVALADLEMRAGRLSQARRLLRRALRRPGGRVPEVYRALARWARRAGHARLAARYERRAARLAARAGGGGG